MVAPDPNIDLRQQVPDLVPYLLPGERVVYVKHVPMIAIAQPPSSIRELSQLTQDMNGPIIASKPLNSREHRPELRLYETVFGRDSLRVALNLLERYPKLARSTLLGLARLQGQVTDPHREEEPGRIIHEVRDPEKDPIARELTAKRGWAWPYYGSVDATPEFIRLFSAYCRHSLSGLKLLKETYIAKDKSEHTMAEALEAAVKWTTNRLDLNPEGLLEYKSAIPGGIENQVWKDSWDSYFHSDGSLANSKYGIASIEVQRLAYDALIDAASLYEEHLGKIKEGSELRERAARLKKQIMNRFWTEEKSGYFCLATDRNETGQLEPLMVRTSNMGHLLHSRILQGENPAIIYRREAVIRQLFSPQMLNVSGIRTLATDEKRFRPGSYHNGSVWLWDTYLIAQGLEQQGYHKLAQELERRIRNIIVITRQFPEFVRGDDGDRPSVNQRIVDVWDSTYHRINRIEQPPQEVQAWSVAAILSMKLTLNKSISRLMRGHKDTFEKEILSTLR